MKFFLQNNSQKTKIFNELKETFASWKNEVQSFNKPFFAIHSDFKHLFLKDLSGGALKLYVFLGLHSKHQTGESWYSANDVAEFFEKDSRTISNWFKELEDSGLIVREQLGFKMKANTFLRPYGFVIDIFENQVETSIEDVRKYTSFQPSRGYTPYFGLILNYVFKEYTVLLFYKTNGIKKGHPENPEALFRVSCFLNFNELDISKLRHSSKTYEFDYFDIDYPVSSSKYKKLTIFNYINSYLDSEGKGEHEKGRR